MQNETPLPIASEELFFAARLARQKEIASREIEDLERQGAAQQHQINIAKDAMRAAFNLDVEPVQVVPAAEQDDETGEWHPLIKIGEETFRAERGRHGERLSLLRPCHKCSAQTWTPIKNLQHLGHVLGLTAQSFECYGCRHDRQLMPSLEVLRRKAHDHHDDTLSTLATVTLYQAEVLASAIPLLQQIADETSGIAGCVELVTGLIDNERLSIRTIESK